MNIIKKFESFNNHKNDHNYSLDNIRGILNQLSLFGKGDPSWGKLNKRMVMDRLIDIALEVFGEKDKKAMFAKFRNRYATISAFYDFFESEDYDPTYEEENVYVLINLGNKALSVLPKDSPKAIEIKSIIDSEIKKSDINVHNMDNFKVTSDVISDKIVSDYYKSSYYNREISNTPGYICKWISDELNYLDKGTLIKLEDKLIGLWSDIKRKEDVLSKMRDKENSKKEFFYFYRGDFNEGSTESINKLNDLANKAIE